MLKAKSHSQTNSKKRAQQVYIAQCAHWQQFANTFTHYCYSTPASRQQVVKQERELALLNSHQNQERWICCCHQHHHRQGHHHQGHHHQGHQHQGHHHRGHLGYSHHQNHCGTCMSVWSIAILARFIPHPPLGKPQPLSFF